MQGPDDALTVIAYEPCLVHATVNGAPVALEVQTSYPFEETVRITVGLDQPQKLTLRLRIPQWCTAATLSVAGAEHPVRPTLTGT